MKKNVLFIFILLLAIGAKAQKMTLAFDHHALAVQNIETSMNFYKNILMLDEIATPVNNPKIKWFSMGGNYQLHLIEVDPLDIKTDKANHFSLHIADINEFVAYLNLKGIPFWDWVGNAQKVALRPDGVQQVYIQDPDGYWIEINDAKY
ncbi:MAG: VOC family protein [Flavobacteriaceae bacterium]